MAGVLDYLDGAYGGAAAYSRRIGVTEVELVALRGPLTETVKEKTS
jgi:hypothetical protein